MLGVIDWGIGGLGVVRALDRSACRGSIVYLSDSGSVPYGRLARRALEERLVRAVEFLRGQGADHVLLACNAASTALPSRRLVNVSGVIAPTVKSLRALRDRRVAVVGGRRTIVSRVYHRALAANSIEVVGRVAQPLSGLIERGQQHSTAFDSAVAKVLRGLSADALLLACTHYPAAISAFERHFAGRVIDPLPAVARAVPRSGNAGDDRYFTTGDVRQMQSAAQLAWGIRLRARAARFG